MNQVLLIATWLLPLAIAPFVFSKHAHRLIVPASLPAMVTALTVENDQLLHIPWLLLGTHLGIDELTRWLLLASAFVWLVATIYAATKKTTHYFYLFFTLAMSGNFLLLLAMDMVTFYLGFALMGLATAPLIMEKKQSLGPRSLRLYLMWTIAGELILFSAMVMLASHAGNLRFDLLILTGVNSGVLLLIVIGFGIKIALPGLHFWMPFTYASLPTAAVAVVSGPMISAGILGLIRFLAPGSIENVFIGQALMFAGLMAVCYAVIIGLMQTQAKIMLAYSSMSKMGLLAAALGVAMTHTAHAPIIVTAVMLYTIHHLLIKSALFFAVGLAEQTSHRIAFIAGLSLLAFSLAGIPFTSGALAKTQLSTALIDASDFFVIALSLAALLTALLTIRVFYLIAFADNKTRPTNASNTALTMWWLMITAIIIWPWLLGQPPFSWKDITILLIAVTLAAGAWIFKPDWLARYIGSIPAGDMLHIINMAGKRVAHTFLPLLSNTNGVILATLKQLNIQYISHLNSLLQSIQQQPLTWRSAGILWLIVGTIMFIAFFISIGSIDAGEIL